MTPSDVAGVAREWTKVRFRGPVPGYRGRPASRCVGRAADERPRPGGKPVRKRGPDTLLAGARDHQVWEVEPRFALLYIVLFSAFFLPPAKS